MNREEAIILFKEFFRYAVVGGIAFFLDFGTLVLVEEMLFNGLSYGIYFATALGFVVGLAVNYALSLVFVFTQEADRHRGRSLCTFAIFCAVGLLGLFWTELGMWFGVDVLEWNYEVVKILVTGVVLVWNYLGRKLLVFTPNVIR